MINTLIVLFKKECRCALRRLSDLLNPLLFFVIVIILFPLGLSADPKLLHQIAPGIIWVAALLATLLSLDRLFRNDFDDGSLEQLVLSSQPLALIVLVKVFAFWLLTGLPLILLSPVIAVLFDFSSQEQTILVLTLLLGTPLLSLLGAIGAGLTVSLRGGSVLLALLVLPLFIPTLIFASQALALSAMGMAVTGQLAILAAMLVLALTLTPVSTAAAIRIGLM